MRRSEIVQTFDSGLVIVISMPNLRTPFVAILLMFAATAALPAQTKPATCGTTESRQLDFWVGDWDAFDYDNQKVVAARAHIDRILDNCVILENYEQVDGLHGQSFSTYDASRKLWHQTWVTNRGTLLIVEGTMHGDELVMTGTYHAKGVEVRTTWKAIEGGVRETAVTSKDHGKTW